MKPDKKKRNEIVFTIQSEKDFIRFMETHTYTNVPEYPFGLGKEWEK